MAVMRPAGSRLMVIVLPVLLVMEEGVKE